MNARDILDRARDELRMLSVASALGCTLGKRRDILGCPLCGAERRHPSRHDRRGAIGCRPDDCGGVCHECGATFDAIDLVAAVLHQRRLRELDGDRQRDVVEWIAGYLGVEMDSPRARQAAEQRARAPRIAPEPASSRTYPALDAVEAVWSAAGPAIDDIEVAAYLETRGVDPVAMTDRDLARVIAPTSTLPAWATFSGSPWTVTGHRLVVPLYDSRGRMRSLLARRVGPGESPKSIAPAGHTRAALVLACPLARLLLATGRTPAWWVAEQRLRVVVCEGEVDALLVASRFGDGHEHAPATLGIFSGSWTSDLAARIPDGSEVIIATDDDPAGEKYAEAIVASTRRTVALSRWRPAA